MNIHTKELEIFSLDYEMLSMFINDIPSLEKSLGCVCSVAPTEGLLREVVQVQLILSISDSPKRWFWHSFWLILKKSDKKIIGFLILRENEAFETQDVEIGYFLGSGFRHKGYMTAAVKALTAFAKNEMGVKNIFAETKIDAIPSQKLLRGCGFNEYKRTDLSFWFKL